MGPLTLLDVGYSVLIKKISGRDDEATEVKDVDLEMALKGLLTLVQEILTSDER